MCEANVYLRDKEGKEELFLERVDRLIPSEKGIVMENIYSQRKMIKATIKEMELVSHKIIIEKIN
ncbi:MAG: CooT family nickel-binding protein [Clostridium sp.]|uniref:CooT family nickel-binding protein n=1 Tax=Clostridium sp. TaxID=1506 RepID=UPI003F3D9AD1